ncbi:MAG: Ku protein, partial [Pseudobdellovibrionaceae bacterium]
QNKAPIHYKKINAETGHEVPSERIVKAYELKKGQFVILTDQDFKNANPKATHSVDIEDFVPFQDIDLLMFEKPYYLVPQKEGEKAYFLLKDALQNTQRVAIAKIVIRSKQHLCAILPQGDYLILELLRFSHEVKELEEADFLKGVKKAKYSEKEIEMAESLIKGMSSDWKPDRYKDTYYEDVMKMIKEKAKSGKEFQAPEIEEEASEIPSNVRDLLPLLRKSLEAKRKSKSSRSLH